MSRKVEARSPAEQALRQRRVGVAGGDVAGAARRDAVRHLAPAGALEGAHHLEHAVPRPVPRLTVSERGAAEQVAQRGDVAFGEVDDVDVVAHAGAVGRVVVVAEHLQHRRLPTATCAT